MKTKRKRKKVRRGEWQEGITKEGRRR